MKDGNHGNRVADSVSSDLSIYPCIMMSRSATSASALHMNLGGGPNVLDICTKKSAMSIFGVFCQYCQYLVTLPLIFQKSSARYFWLG